MRTEHRTITIYKMPSGMELNLVNADPRDIAWLNNSDQQRQQAHREGWEQAKRECVEKIDSEICDCCWGEEAQEASDHLCETIAAMEYGGGR